jgi:SRSO17 transposase
MTEQDIAGMTPAFASYLGQFRDCFPQKRTMTHFDNYCRGLLADLPRKSIEPIALASGTAVRTLQEFLSATRWDQELARNLLQQNLAATAAAIPDDSLGTIGVIDETSCRKWGDQTPGVQRQYLGCVGKVDNGIVTVHVGLAKGRFQTLLDADLYLPESWDQDRERCRAAGIPDEVRYRPKWRIALDQVVRLSSNGGHFDWLTFDEGYGAIVPFLNILNLVKQRFVAEVPVNFMVCNTEEGTSRRADERLSVAKAKKGRRYRLKHQTVKDSAWRAVEASVWVEGHSHRLIVAINEATAEVKYFLTNATDALARVLALAALLAAHREANPKAKNLAAWDVEVLWLRKDYAGTVDAIHAKRLAFLENGIHRWKCQGYLIRSLVRLQKTQEAVKEAERLTQKKHGPNLLMVLALASTKDVPATLAFLDKVNSQRYLIDDCYYDEDLGPILRGDGFSAFRERYAEPPPIENFR